MWAICALFRRCAIYENMTMIRTGRDTNRPHNVYIGVDWGVGVSVWPSSWNNDYPLRNTGRCGDAYAAAGAGNQEIVKDGERHLRLRIAGSDRGAKMQIARFRKPLLSLADMVDAGQYVHFPANGQYFAVHPGTGEVIHCVRRRQVFEIDAEVQQCTRPKKAAAGFRGHL